MFTDVDTPEPDEKSLITYVSQLYEIFPEPPNIHPLFSVVSYFLLNIWTNCNEI